MKKLLIVLLGFAAVQAEDQAEAEYNRAVEKAKSEYDAKVKIAKDKYAASLKAEMDALTKKGDLDGALKVREKLAKEQGSTVELPKTAGGAKNKIVIKSCEWGVGKTKIDLAKIVEDALDKDPYTPVDANNLTDPAPGKTKTLVISYEYNGVPVTETIKSDDASTIPHYPKEGVASGDASKELRIVAARWGAGVKWIDVTALIQEAAKDPFQSFLVPALDDPAFGVHKKLVVWFEFENRRYCTYERDSSNKIFTLLPKR
jgi:hypothetical protein